MRIRHGYTDPDRIAVFELRGQPEVVAEKDVPAELVPPRGSPEHLDMFKGKDTLIAVRLGKQLA